MSNPNIHTYFFSCVFFCPRKHIRFEFSMYSRGFQNLHFQKNSKWLTKMLTQYIMENWQTLVLVHTDPHWWSGRIFLFRIIETCARDRERACVYVFVFVCLFVCFRSCEGHEYERILYVSCAYCIKIIGNVQCAGNWWHMMWCVQFCSLNAPGFHLSLSHEWKSRKNLDCTENFQPIWVRARGTGTGTGTAYLFPSFFSIFHFPQFFRFVLYFCIRFNDKNQATRVTSPPPAAITSEPSRIVCVVYVAQCM